MKHFKTLIFLFSIFIIAKTQAQVTGLSYTIAPSAEYNWFHEKSGINNGFLGGAQIGFGFGEYVELGANYQQGFGLKTGLSRFGEADFATPDSSYVQREVSLTRYGGEIKLNLSRGALLPYLTVGTGIQNLEADSLGNHKQIYLTTGLGIKFSAVNRYTIGVQALRTTYRSNSVNTLMNEEERALYGFTSNSFLNESLSNYALRASLVLYLGGRKPGETTAVDQAYFDNFSGGLSGLSIPVEPTVMKMNFNDDLLFRSTWMAGGSAGINLGPLVGVRAFYWRALEEGKRTDFDDLTMYGGEGRFKLNEGKGFTPWLSVGGGKLNVGDEYVGRDSLATIDDKAFAMGGLGMDLPFTKYFKATGYVRSILTSTQSADDLAMPEDIKNSWSYGVSLNFILGKKPAKVEKVQQDAMDAYLLSTTQGYNVANEQLKSEYDKKIANLEKQLEVAVQNQDTEAVKSLSDQKEIAKQVRSTIGNNNNGSGSNPNSQPAQMMNRGNSVIQMTPAEFQLLLRDIMEGSRNNNSGSNNSSGNSQNGQNLQGGQSDIDDAIKDFKQEQDVEDLEEAIAELKDQNKSLQSAVTDLKSKESDLAEEMEDLVKVYNDKIYTLERESTGYRTQIDDLYNTQSAIEKGLKKQEGMVTVESIDSKKMNEEMRAVNKRIDRLSNSMENSLEDVKEYLYQDKRGNTDRDSNMDLRNDIDMRSNAKPSNKTRVRTDESLSENDTGVFSKLTYTGMSGFAGFGIGGTATFNIGYRLHYAIDSTKIEFMPETFFGLGSPSSFGLMANATYSLDFITKSDLIQPYVGLGLGLMKIGDDQDADQLKTAFNFIAGTSLNVWNGDLYVDFTARNIFKYNQLIVGYRFPF